MKLTPGSRLGSYEVRSALGEGGMGEVYRATDTRLGRDVALKLLPAAIAGDPGRVRRLHLEARALAALNHPHIVTLHSVEEADGVPFLTMELVDGPSLDRLIPNGGLPIDRVVAIGAAIAEALAAAHEKGIVHRDLKPSNVVVTADGWIKVLDFGLAKALRAGESDEDVTTIATRTAAGVVMGTPAYMSPEQVAGRAIDHRTDLFSLGVVLYELTSGRRPFDAPSAAELASAILRDAPPPIRDLRPDVAPDLARIIRRCLEKDPGQRIQTARDVANELRDIVRDRAEAVAPAPPAAATIAVLPFVNSSEDPANAYFGDGLAEEILNALAQIEGLHVAARSSSFSFKGRSAPASEIGARLHVAHILEGSVRRAGSRVRVTVQLVDAGNDFQLWSERYDRQIEDIFEVQDDIARAIAGRLRVSLAAGREEGQPHPPTRDIAAYELYLKGRTLLYQRGGSALKAIDCFTEAVALDGDYAQAWAGLADAYTILGQSGFKPATEVMPLALKSARRALYLDPGLAEAHGALACATMLYERDYAFAGQEFRRSLALNPRYPQARAWYALWYLQWVEGREQEAREEIALLLRGDPLSAYAHVIQAFSDFTSGREAEAVEAARRGIEIDPHSFLASWTHALALDVAGRFEESAAAGERALVTSGRHTWTVTGLAIAYAHLGQRGRALALYEELQERAGRETVQSTMLSSTAAALGRLDEAIGHLDRADEQRDPLLVMLARSWPWFDPLRSDARFTEIVGRLRLPRPIVAR